MAQARGQFSSKLGFILAAAGSAVGLGNLVAFPVMASKNGGAAFLIIYLLFVAFICYPVMMAEIAMGRRSKLNPVGAFDTIAGGSAKWRLTGILAIITPSMIAAFYPVLTVWLVVYLNELASGGLGRFSQEAPFGGIVASPSLFGIASSLPLSAFLVLSWCAPGLI